jgi:hypothetical protein
VFGFGEAKDTSWLTPSIRRAFEQSSELWLEICASVLDVPIERTIVEQGSAFGAAIERLARLVDFVRRVGAVGPGTNARVHRGTRNQSGLDSTNASLEGILLNRPGILVQTTGDPNQVDVDAVLGSMARAAEKRVDYEFRTASRSRRSWL